MYKVFRIRHDSPVYVNPIFLLHLLKSDAYLQIYKKLGKGSVKRRKSVSFNEFSSIRVPIPPKEIQDGVAQEYSRKVEYARLHEESEQRLKQQVTEILKTLDESKPNEDIQEKS